MKSPIYAPMLAILGEPFDSPEHYFEIKWDGYRAVLHRSSHQTLFLSRNRKDLSSYFPSLVTEADFLPDEVVLDGEIIAVDQDGKPNFSLLQECFFRKEGLIHFMVFDVLNISGNDLCDSPLIKRRQLLANLMEGSPSNYNLSIIFDTNGMDLFALVCNQGLEGIMAKAKKSLYYPGRRSADWVKIKNRKTTQAVVCGYVSQNNRLKSLVLGQFKGDELVYVGNVGTGFSNKVERDLLSILAQFETKRPPFAAKVSLPQPVCYVVPCIVALIEYQEYTREGYLRQGVFKGVVPDTPITECAIGRNRD